MAEVVPPIPQELIDAMLIVDAGAGVHATERHAMRFLLAAALAWRDSEGHPFWWGQLEQVGIWITGEQPERMSNALWAQERLCDLVTMEDEGGLNAEWESRAVPVYIVREET